MGITRRLAAQSGVLAAAGVLLGGVRPGRASAQAEDVAAKYCTVSGGTVVERSYVQTPGDPPELLAVAAPFCEFTGGEGAEPAESRIAISLDALFATGPTLATLAYREKRPMPAIDPPAPVDGTPVVGMPNPASIYCQQQGGVEADWYAKDAPADQQSVTMCVFPDFTAIDSWGLAYHAMGTIRGADLDPLLHWQRS